LGALPLLEPDNVNKLHIFVTAIIELSVKEEKHSTRTLSLVIHRVRFKKKQSTLAFNGA
jgi:hypothetical protein